MAKRKTEEAVANPNDVAAANSNPEASGEQEVVESPANEANTAQSEEIPAEAPEAEKKETKKSRKSKSEGDSKAQSEEIPADILKVLKSFPHEEELYVSKFGGVYTKDTEPSVVAGAILYKNPYYK